jgi:NAD(P)-dependent dehydrogenase (short-subunit alcohol dehydrogenase family)
MAGMMEGKVVVVTGAGGGIGREIAIMMAAAGAKVIIADVGASLTGSGASDTPAQQTQQIIRQGGGAAEISTDSVAEWNSAQRIIQAAIDHFGRIDAVVNNAGILRDGIFHRMSADDWLAVISVHLNGSFFVSRAAAEHFRKQESGAFVHITSTSGLRQRRTGQLCSGQARHHGIIKIDCTRHAALQRAFELPVPLGMEPHDEFHPSHYAGAESRCRETTTHDTRQECATRRIPGVRRGKRRHRSGVRHTHERDLSVQLAKAHPNRPSRRRMDARGDRAASDPGGPGGVHAA